MLDTAPLATGEMQQKERVAPRNRFEDCGIKKSGRHTKFKCSCTRPRALADCVAIPTDQMSSCLLTRPNPKSLSEKNKWYGLLQRDSTVLVSVVGDLDVGGTDVGTSHTRHPTVAFSDLSAQVD